MEIELSRITRGNINLDKIGFEIQFLSSTKGKIEFGCFIDRSF